MPRNQWQPIGRIIAVIDVQVGAADTAALYLDQHIGRTAFRNRHVTQFELLRCNEYSSFHDFLSEDKTRGRHGPSAVANRGGDARSFVANRAVRYRSAVGLQSGAIEGSAHPAGSTRGASVRPRTPVECQPGRFAGCLPAVPPYARRGCWSGSRDGRERIAVPPL